MLKIKAENISNLTDARYFAAKDVSFLTYDFNDPCIDVHTINTLIEWVQGPATVINVKGLELDAVFMICDQIQFPYLQISIKDLLSNDYTVFKKEIIVEGIWEDVERNIEFLIQKEIRSIQLKIDDSTNIVDSVKKLIDIFDFTSNFNIIVNAELHINEIENIYALLPDITICINGSDEEKVGVKNFEDIDLLFDKLEQLY